LAPNHLLQKSSDKILSSWLVGADELTDPLHVTNIHATFPAYKLWTHCKQEQSGNVEV